jgi:NADPH-dependent curcumin reductase CurA
VLDGIEQAPAAIAGLYRGETLGKRLIRIADLRRMPRLHRS